MLFGQFAISAVAVTDGKRLICMRVRNHDSEQPPSLYWSNKAGSTLNSQYPDHPNGQGSENSLKQTSSHGRHVVVASEPTTCKADKWNLIEKKYDGNHE